MAVGLGMISPLRAGAFSGSAAGAGVPAAPGFVIRLAVLVGALGRP